MKCIISCAYTFSGSQTTLIVILPTATGTWSIFSAILPVNIKRGNNQVNYRYSISFDKIRYRVPPGTFRNTHNNVCWEKHLSLCQNLIAIPTESLAGRADVI